MLAPSMSHLALPHDHASCLKSQLRLNVWSAAQHGALCRLEQLLAEDGGGQGGGGGAAPAAARANKLNELSHSPLQLAALGGHAACVSLLLAHGADAAGADAGYSALHRACAKGHADCARLLLAAPGGAARALLELRDAGTGDGRSALAKAAAGGHAECVRLLLDAGADARALDARGRSPRALAEAGGHAEAAALLPPDEPAPVAAQNKE